MDRKYIPKAPYPQLVSLRSLLRRLCNKLPEIEINTISGIGYMLKINKE